MSPYIVQLILEFFSARLATLPYGLDSNVTQLLANLITKPSVFYYVPIVSSNLVSIKLLLLLCLVLYLSNKFKNPMCSPNEFSAYTLCHCSAAPFKRYLHQLKNSDSRQTD